VSPHWRNTVRDVVAKVLDQAIEKGNVDFVDEVGGRITLGVLATMLGAPERDWPQLYDLANMAVGADDPEFAEPFLRELSSPRAMVRELVRAAREFGFDGLKALPVLRKATPAQRRVSWPYTRDAATSSAMHTACKGPARAAW